ncbi:uncharacterized protein LOC115884776 isoform X2 [Sitophilus oryzae]|uniref:Uncharacterized protein LOC115874789 isoform X2 n=2 Tax=Cucujiformia TaxID=41088 RepID=A0A6J2Y6R8_SITOR|nr:uncharacterized protein LOC115874789 isoform X2 [Sitophilus oryzae]XP_030750851.1 uncharacterized protein LOC115878473 isoform X2 [Sitophilus oryzae]XP_030759312.1 uncharacterized protein LOC115884776 isoform X2 [Sitophilus oryzae]
MDGEEIDSWSDLGSGDEWLCAQLQKSGLMSKHKRRKQSCKEDNKIIKLDVNQKDPPKNETIATPINDQNFGESIKGIISSQDNVNAIFDQNIDLDNIENIDIHNLQVVEKVGNDFFDLQHIPPEFATVTIEYPQPSALNVANISVESENVVQELGNIHIEALPTNTQDPVSDIVINTDTDIIDENKTTQTNIQQSSVSATPSCSSKVVILSNIPYHGDLLSNKKRQNKASKDPNKYKRNINKELRMKGESYLGYRRDRKAKTNEKFKVKQDVFKPARSMKPPCTSAFCKKSKLRSCDNINEEQRKYLFDNFWKNMNWEQRRSFITSHVNKVSKKVTKNPESSKRTDSRTYVLTIDNVRHQVCKKMFLATLGIKDWFIRYWLTKTDCAMPPDVSSSTSNRRNPEKIEDHKHVEKFLGDLPKMPSHYCRAKTSREYLEPIFSNMTQLYHAYKDNCELEGRECLGRKLFDKLFLKLNLSLFHPKKDQCDVCCSHKTGNITDEEYAQHVLKKDRARKEKDTDKGIAQSGACHVFTQDVESVKLAPYLQASAIYYKTKLCVHNFTLYNIATKEVMCYWFDESNSTLEASVFASCLVDHLEKVLSLKLLPVVLYSDGCCAQNRNVTLSNALLRLAIEKNIVITQKYLEKGHTHMECDSVHSAIECKLKGKEIYLPQQYMAISKTARSDPMPYQACYLDYTFFTDFSKELIYKSIRPGKKVGDPVVTDLRMLEYRPNGTIWYKVSFDDELHPLPHRPTAINSIKQINSLQKLYAARIPITKRKYQDLQDLKSVLPSSCHSFYDDLPHSNH